MNESYCFAGASFPISLLPWIRCEITYKEGFLEIKSTNAFGPFPAGEREESIPVSLISSCSFSAWYDGTRIFCGCGVLLAAFLLFTGSFPSAWHILVEAAGVFIGISLVLSGIRGEVTIEKRAGRTRISVPFYERKAGRDAAALITDILRKERESGTC